MSGDDNILSVQNLRVSFRLDKQTIVEALKGVSFDIPRNSTVALVGESGSGKSVSSLAILGLLPKENALVAPESKILYQGRDLLRTPQSELRRLRGRVEKAFNLSFQIISRISIIFILIKNTQFKMLVH